MTTVDSIAAPRSRDSRVIPETGSSYRRQHT
jgi:hypothetical protein